MATSYTTLLGLALPVQGELSGTWGDTVNDYITQYLDAAVAGTQTISGSQTAVTLSKTTNASLSQAGSGATGSSQYQIINCTGNPGGLLTITAPAASKAYLVLNNTSTNQSVKVVGAGPTTGVTVTAGERCLISWNGSDFVKVGGTNGTGEFVTVDTTNLEVTNIKAKDGTASMSIADSTGVASFSANPVLSGGTANGVAYLNGSKVLTTGSALTFDGTTLTSATYIKTGGGAASNTSRLMVNTTNGTAAGIQLFQDGVESWIMGMPASSGALTWANSGTEQMRLTSTGLGIGTSSPFGKLDVNGTIATSASGGASIYFRTSGTTNYSWANQYPSAGNFSLYDHGAGATVFTVNSGNLGLGVTPSAWSTWKALDINTNGAIASASASLTVGTNFYWNGSNWIYKSSSANATRIGVGNGDGSFQFFTAPSGTAGNAISFTQAMTLDASQRLMIGTTTAGASGTSVTVYDSTQSEIRLQNSTTGTGVSAGLQLALSGTTAYLWNIANGPLVFATNNTERARIDSLGNLLVGTTAALGRRLVIGGTTTTARVIPATDNVGSVGDISYRWEAIYAVNGTIQTSDAREKSEIQDSALGLAFINALRPVSYKWNENYADQRTHYGLIAQEVKAVVPDGTDFGGLVEQEDGTRMSLAYTEFVAPLIKAIQEQQAIIIDLRARVAALEAA